MDNKILPDWMARWLEMQDDEIVDTRNAADSDIPLNELFHTDWCVSRHGALCNCFQDYMETQ